MRTIVLRPEGHAVLTVAPLGQDDAAALEPFLRPLRSPSLLYVPRLATPKVATAVRALGWSRLLSRSDKSCFRAVLLATWRGETVIHHAVLAVYDWKGGLDYDFWRIEDDVVPSELRGAYAEDETGLTASWRRAVAEQLQSVLVGYGESLVAPGIEPFTCVVTACNVAYGCSGGTFFDREFDVDDEEWTSLLRGPCEPDEVLRARKDRTLDAFTSLLDQVGGISS